jgi:hypothetical protein
MQWSTSQLIAYPKASDPGWVGLLHERRRPRCLLLRDVQRFPLFAGNPVNRDELPHDFRRTE